MRSLLIAAGVVGVVVLALYHPSLDNPLVWDDTIHVGQARRGQVAELLRSDQGEYRRPLVLLSYVAQVRAGLGSPRALHAANLVLHAANAVLVYALSVRLGLVAPAALAAACLFAAHPVQSGAVAYVSGRTDLLVALFCLLALLAVAGPGATGVGTSVAVAVCVAAAALSKENGLVAAALVGALWYLVRAHSRPRGWAPLLAAVGALACTAPLVLPPALGEHADLALSTRLAGAGRAAATYATLLVWPTDLHLDRLSDVGDGAHLVLLGAALAPASAGALARLAARPTAASFAVVAAVVAYLPGAGFVPVYPAIAERWVFTPEHFLYLPLAAIAPLTMGVLHRVLGGRRLAARSAIVLGAITVLITVASAGSIRDRQRDLADEERLFRQTLAHSPSPRACFNLGVRLIARRAYAEAAAVYERCTVIAPHDAAVWGQLGLCHANNGQRNKAEMAYARALELDPYDALTWSNHAALDANAGFYGDAREKWRRALALDATLEPAVRGLERLDRLEAGRR